MAQEIRDIETSGPLTASLLRAHLQPGEHVVALARVSFEWRYILVVEMPTVGPPAVSPHKCQHAAPLLVIGSCRSAEFAMRTKHEIAVCRDCGRFFVSAEKDGTHYNLTFELGTGELAHAACQYVRYLNQLTQEN